MPEWVDEMLRDPVLAQYAPDRPWTAAQREEHVLFLHHRIDPAAMRALVPPELTLQQYDGSAWLAVIACRLTDGYMYRVPMPGFLGDFAEIDCAALVSYEDRLGLYFLGIEGAHRFTSWAVRWSTGLPYRFADTKLRDQNGSFHVSSGPRWVRGAAAATFDAVYRPSTANVVPDPGSPIEVLTGQYSAFTVHRGKVCELDEIHSKWQLQEADLDLSVNTLPSAVGLPQADRPELVHYARGRSIVSWLPQPVGAHRSGLAPVEPPGRESV